MAPAPFPFLEAAAGCTLATYVLETVLDWRQYAVLRRKEMSPALHGVVSEERFGKAQRYGLDKSALRMVHSLYSTAIELAVLLLRVMPRVWELAADLLPSWLKGYESAQSVAFLAIFLLISTLQELPFSLYGSFVVEARYGFNKQTLLGFFRDLLLELALSAVLGPPIIVAAIAVIHMGGPPWKLALSLWLLIFTVSVLLMVLYPVAIAPLFNRFTPLPEGHLRSKIEALAASLKFPLTKLLVVDGSTRSAHSNAYLYGFFRSKRIVLYDTLLAQCKDAEEQVVAVIAHELGHWKLSHTISSFVCTQAVLLLNLSAYGVLAGSPQMFRSFGFSSEPAIIGLLLAQHALAPIGPLLTCALNAMSRRFEFQADGFARKLGYALPLRNGLIKMQEENLGTMATDPWYSIYHYSHPPLVERLSALELEDKKQQ